MRTRRPAADHLPADELFRSRLENQIDLRHPLVQLEPVNTNDLSG
ncbi:hypothetical protein [Xanthomonas nasturtii]